MQISGFFIAWDFSVRLKGRFASKPAPPMVGCTQVQCESELARDSGRQAAESLRHLYQIHLRLEHVEHALQVHEPLLFLAPTINKEQPVIVHLNGRRDDFPSV